MAVDGVNNNNTAIYAGTGAAAAGALAGGATGYFTKSFLKDGEPTDEFVKKVMKNTKKELAEYFPDLKDAGEQFKGAKTVDECKNIIEEQYRTLLKDVDLNMSKNAIKANAAKFEEIGLKGIDTKAIDKASNLDELLDLFSKNFDENFAGKSAKEVREAYDTITKKGMKDIVKTGLAAIYDFDKKKFVDLGELGDTPIEQFIKKSAKAYKDAASSIKWKAAGIYGGIAAALLGAATYLGVASGSKAPAYSQAEEQVQESQQAEA